MLAGATPVPLSEIFWGLLFALSVIVTVPVRDPEAVGVKVIEMAQLPRAATELPQVLVWAKSPLTTMLPTLKATDELLLSVTDLAALVLPTAILPNEREVLDKLARWATAGGTAAIMRMEARRTKFEATTRRRIFMPLLGNLLTASAPWRYCSGDMAGEILFAAGDREDTDMEEG